MKLGRKPEVDQNELAHFTSAPVHSGLFPVFLPNFVRPYLLHTLSVLRKLGLYLKQNSEMKTMA